MSDRTYEEELDFTAEIVDGQIRVTISDPKDGTKLEAFMGLDQARATRDFFVRATDRLWSSAVLFALGEDDDDN